MLLNSGLFIVVVFGDDSLRHDARQSRHREDRRGRRDCALSLYCTALPKFQNQATSTIPSVNKSTHLAAGPHFHPWIQSMRTARYEVLKSLSCGRQPK